MLVRAMMAHLYLAWIHPFGDGNGRTARLVEFLILARSGKVPLPAAHLLSNHYNLTRDQYYRELGRASKTNSIVEFVSYATEGFVDGIRDEIEVVRLQQLQVAWVNFVSEVMSRYPTGKASDRQREVVLAMLPQQKLWNYCNILRDDGLSYGDYVEQLTFLLFLKMADEHTRPPHNKPSAIPKGSTGRRCWPRMATTLEVHYRHTLEELGKPAGHARRHLPEGAEQDPGPGQAPPPHRGPDRQGAVGPASPPT
jgi:hypothetical protein